MKKIFSLTVFAFFMMVSCTKQKDTPFIEQETFIKIGDVNGMLIDSVQKVIEGAYWYPQTVELDLDKDSLPDVLLKVMIYGSPGMGMHPLAQIECLHQDIGLFGQVFIDTTFFHQHISYYDNNGLINKVIESHFNCKKADSNDEVQRISMNFVLVPLVERDTIHQSDVFSSDTLSFNYTYQSYPFYSYDGGDTAYINSSKSVYDCHAIPYGEIIFVGLKYKTPSTEKLGWIKMRIDAGNRITYFGSALQD